MPPDEPVDPAAVPRDYTRRLYANVLEWYRSAEAKAQIILSLDGVFVAFLTGTLFASPEALRSLAGAFTPASWVLLAAMCASLIGSIGCAVAALWSRTSAGGSVVRTQPTTDGDALVPWFFEHIRFTRHAEFTEQLGSVDMEGEVATLAQQIHVLSGTVSRKHAWVNRGFLLAGLSFALFLAAGISYVVGVVL